MNLKNEKLIQAACMGNKQALEQLLILCQPDFARRTCSSAEDVEDAVQIALRLMYRKIGTLKTIATFASWLFRIIERECYRLFRARQSKSINSEFNLENIAMQNTDLSLHIDLTNAIGSLPFIYRQVLILRDIEEYSAPEVAEKLGITIEAVKSRLHRARMITKEKLDSKTYLNYLLR